MTKPSESQRKRQSWLCWAGALLTPIPVMAAWFALCSWGSPERSAVDFVGFPLPFFVSVGFLSRLPTTVKDRVCFSILFVVVMAVPLFYAGVVLAFLFGPPMRLF